MYRSSLLIRRCFPLRGIAIRSSVRSAASRIDCELRCAGQLRSSSMSLSPAHPQVSSAAAAAAVPSPSSSTLSTERVVVVVSQPITTTSTAAGPLPTNPCSGLAPAAARRRPPSAVESSALADVATASRGCGGGVDNNSSSSSSSRQHRTLRQLPTQADTIAAAVVIPTAAASPLAVTSSGHNSLSTTNELETASAAVTTRSPPTLISPAPHRPPRVVKTTIDGGFVHVLKDTLAPELSTVQRPSGKVNVSRSDGRQNSRTESALRWPLSSQSTCTTAVATAGTGAAASGYETPRLAAGTTTSARAVAEISRTVRGDNTTATTSAAAAAAVVGGKRSVNWTELLQDPCRKRQRGLVSGANHSRALFGCLSGLRGLSTFGSDRSRTGEEHSKEAEVYESTGKSILSSSTTLNRSMTKQTTAPAAAAVETTFPEAALLPKQETGVQTFLTKHPTYDGRGAVIAIFDSGVDPRAAGLQVTTDGKPKVIQMLSASGVGDVDMRTQVTPEDGVIKGISGRSLRIPASWKNPSGKYRIGLKPIFDVYPSSLKERMQKDYKEKNWSALLQPTLAEVTRKLQRLEVDSPNEKTLKEELEARVEVLTKMDKNYVDLGPVYDCLLWNDGTSWKAVLDTTEEGALDKCEVVGPYAETLKVSTLLAEDNLSYAVNVYDDGDILEIVTTGSHATHVASIAAANFPENPARNGVAPGAQIISVSVSDNRVSTMETGTSLYRAMAAVMKHDVDVINMSYGETSKWRKGRVWEYFEEMINKKGVTMLVSAGNKGPALSTVGAPPTQNGIGVGAVVTPQMMEAEYSLREKAPTVGYNWTSRGPGCDGHPVVAICAPGAAITSVPPYMLQGSQLMNGTSMASPNAAGIATLLVSAMKQNGIKGSPYMLKRALENSAVKFASYDSFTHGQGLVQVERAWDWIQSVKGAKENLLRFELKAEGNMRGIYLREPSETATPQIKGVHVQPVFINDKKVPHDLKTTYDQNFTLSCDAPWVQIPSMLNMMYQERAISIKVDPTVLEEGRAHFTQVEAFESGMPDKGPVFRIPITVIKPQSLPASTRVFADKVVLRPGVANRWFLAVPSGATWGFLKLKSLDAVKPGHVSLQTVQLQPDASYADNCTSKMPQIQPLGEVSYAIPVVPDRTLEICLNKWWTSFGDMSLAWSIQFFGLTPNVENLHMASGDGLNRIDVCASLGPEEANPAVSLKQHVIVLKPTKSTISPGGFRDTMPEGRIVHINTLTYALNLTKGGEAMVSLPLLNNYLYESEFCTAPWMIYDQNKQLVACGDSFPDRYSAKLEKGEYTITAQIRHEDRTLLEKLTQELPLQVIMKLSTALNLDVFASPDQGMIQGKKASATTIPAGVVKPYYVGHLPSDKIPKGAAAGHYLQGSLTLTTDEQGKSVAAFPFRYFLNELPTKKKGADKGSKSEKDNNGHEAKDTSKDNDNGNSPKDSPKESTKDSTGSNCQPAKDKEKKTTDEEFEEAACDFCATHLVKTGGAAVEAMYEDLIKRNPQANQMILAQIHYLVKKDKEFEEKNEKSKREETNKQIISCAEQVLVNIKPDKLLLNLGCRQDKSDQATCKQLDKQKQLVVDVLTKKGEALCNLLTLKQAQSPSSAQDDTLRAKIDELFTELQRWVDPLNDVKTASFVERYLNITDQPGKLVRLLMKVQEDKATIETENKLIDVYKKLNWQHCIKLSQRHQLNKFPPIYRPQ